MVIHSYDAFGNLLATENSQLATLLSLRFSTKYLDPETGFYYYGYRYYDPELGRWLTRDPIEEQGGLNLYGFCGNDAVNRADRLGETWTEVLAWFGEWLKGNGDLYRVLGPDSNAAKDMKFAPGVIAARDAFRKKNQFVKCCKDLSDYTNHKATFGIPGLIAAGFNSTRQFIGSYRVDIFVFGCVMKKCKIDFELTNTTSFTSFFFTIGPSWERDFFGPMGNVRQTIWWEEEYDAKCP